MSQNDNNKQNGAVAGACSAPAIQSRADFLALVHSLTGQLKQAPQEWENNDLSSFLAALGRWVEDMDGYYKNRGETLPDQPTWSVLADMFLAARVYE